MEMDMGAPEKDPLTNPEDVRGPDRQRQDGRPTGEKTTGLRPGKPQESVPTIAPEEEGETPATEHAPGADL